MASLSTNSCGSPIGTRTFSAQYYGESILLVSDGNGAALSPPGPQAETGKTVCFY